MMKTLIVAVVMLLFTPYYPLFAQNALQKEGLGSTMTEKYHSDPFVSYLLQADHNPCKGGQYLTTGKDYRKAHADSEDVVVRQQREACRDFINAIEQTRSSNEGSDPQNLNANRMKPYYVAGGVAIVIVIVFLL